MVMKISCVKVEGYCVFVKKNKKRVTTVASMLVHYLILKAVTGRTVVALDLI